MYSIIPPPSEGRFFLPGASKDYPPTGRYQLAFSCQLDGEILGLLYWTGLDWTGHGPILHIEARADSVTFGGPVCPLGALMKNCLQSLCSFSTVVAIVHGLFA